MCEECESENNDMLHLFLFEIKCVHLFCIYHLKKVLEDGDCTFCKNGENLKFITV